jgi:hypothetical protein
MKWLFVLLVACKSQPSATATSAPATARVVPPAKSGPATHVVELAPGSATPIVRGPFEITTINPAGDLELGIAKDETCAGVVWFAYSGGGAAVGEGEILCARSGRDTTVTQGFSGH